MEVGVFHSRQSHQELREPGVPESGVAGDLQGDQRDKRGPGPV